MGTVVELAGVNVEDDVVLTLAEAVNDLPLANKLKLAHTFRSQVINLTVVERKKVLSALGDADLQLEGIRQRLLAHPTWRSGAAL